MTIYAGLDVSDKTTHVCVVDGEGVIAWRGVCATDPEVLAKTLRQHAPDLVRAVLETGSYYGDTCNNPAIDETSLAGQLWGDGPPSPRDRSLAPGVDPVGEAAALPPDHLNRRTTPRYVSQPP